MGDIRRAFAISGAIGLMVVGLGMFNYGPTITPPNVISNAAESLSPMCERLIGNIQRAWRTNSMVELDSSIHIYRVVGGFKRCGSNTVRHLLLDAENRS